MPVASHGLAEGEAEVAAGGVEMGMDRERAAEERGGLAVLTEGHVAESLARQRPEVVGLPGEGRLAIGDRAIVVLGEVAHGGPGRARRCA